MEEVRLWFFLRLNLLLCDGISRKEFSRWTPKNRVICVSLISYFRYNVTKLKNYFSYQQTWSQCDTTPIVTLLTSPNIITASKPSITSKKFREHTKPGGWNHSHSITTPNYLATFTYSSTRHVYASSYSATTVMQAIVINYSLRHLKIPYPSLPLLGLGHKRQKSKPAYEPPNAFRLNLHVGCILSFS